MEELFSKDKAEMSARDEEATEAYLSEIRAAFETDPELKGTTLKHFTDMITKREAVIEQNDRDLVQIAKRCERLFGAAVVVEQLDARRATIDVAPRRALTYSFRAYLATLLLLALCAGALRAFEERIGDVFF